MKKRLNIFLYKDVVVVLMIATASVIAFAGGAGAPPWEGPLINIINSLQGPVAAAVGTAAIIFCGLGIAVSEGGSMARTFAKVGFGLALAFSAANWAIGFFGFAGNAAGALI